MLSDNADWVARQKELLGNCSVVMEDGLFPEVEDDLSPEDQRIFMLLCWLQLLAADCRKQKLVDAAKEAAPDDGQEVAEKVAEKVATMVEGRCRHLKYPLKEYWQDCVTSEGLDKSVLKGAKITRYYKLLRKGKPDLPSITQDDVDQVDGELQKLDEVIECYATDSGELDSNGNLNYTRIDQNIDSLTVPNRRRPLKTAAAKAIVRYCRDNQQQTNIIQFYDCYFESRPYGCAAFWSYRFIRRGCLGEYPTGEQSPVP